jgi:hypothetical protein
MENTPQGQIYKPELLPRRGELFAWLCAIALVITWIIVAVVGKPIPAGVKFLGVFLVFAASSISLGNWMDRHTILIIEENGVRYTNKLRKVFLKWEQIDKVEVFNSSWGKKVQIFGSIQHFSFRTLGEIELGGKTKGRMGFARGEEILTTILSRSNLKEIEHSGSSYYYARR